ncbi:hypothetical protein HK098_005076 [Nowakowskiella sp. JEL0407]|nr:hypothetical protein HK098_005076 [Nowakowskiella sp. JEL0407]
MHIWVPATVKPTPSLLVALHYCGGTGPSFHQQMEFSTLADKYGFIVIYPTASKKGNCFDAWTPDSKIRSGKTDHTSIISMVKYVKSRYIIDSVYVAGSSAGAIQTNVLLLLYPEMFKAGAAFMGVPLGCFATESDFQPGGAYSYCTSGDQNKTPKEWGAIARNGYPGYVGSYPKVQLWHGDADPLVNYRNLQEEIDQWTDIFKISLTPSSSDVVRTNWTRKSFSKYGSVVIEAITAIGDGHYLPYQGMALVAINFFGLDGCKSKYQPCGGLHYSGSTCCISGSTCTPLGDYISLCL